MIVVLVILKCSVLFYNRHDACYSVSLEKVYKNSFMLTKYSLTIDSNSDDYVTVAMIILCQCDSR